MIAEYHLKYENHITKKLAAVVRRPLDCFVGQSYVFFTSLHGLAKLKNTTVRHARTPRRYH
jgi:hypothetical protein